MKKSVAIFTAALALLFALGFAACSNGSDSSGSNTDGGTNNANEENGSSSETEAVALDISITDCLAKLDSLAANGGYTFTSVYQLKTDGNDSVYKETSIAGEKDNVYWRYYVDSDACAVKTEEGSVYTRYSGSYQNGVVTWKSKSVGTLPAAFTRDSLILNNATIVQDEDYLVKLEKTDSVAGRECTWYETSGRTPTRTYAVDNELRLILYSYVKGSSSEVTYEITEFSTENVTAPDLTIES